MSLTESQDYYVYVGAARGDNGDEGIYIFRFRFETAEWEPIDVVKNIKNPSFLALDPGGQRLYAIDEDRSQSPSEAGVRAFAIDEHTGRLRSLNRSRSEGEGLCHIIVDQTGRYVLAAHYGSGGVSVLPILEDGRLGTVTHAVRHEGSGVHPRQEAPHPHAIYTDEVNAFVFVPDLGLDQIVVYRFDANRGRLMAYDEATVDVAPGSGPRHFAFHTDGTRAYVINELSSTITVFHYDDTQGMLTPIQTISTLPEHFTGENWTAEISVHPSGRFVYGSNRGHDSIVIFAVDDEGVLSPVGWESTRGGHPRHFALDPTGTYLFAENRDSHTIVTFRIDEQSGKLTATGSKIRVPRPVCIKMIPVVRP